MEPIYTHKISGIKYRLLERKYTAYYKGLDSKASKFRWVFVFQCLNEQNSDIIEVGVEEMDFFKLDWESLRE